LAATAAMLVYQILFPRNFSGIVFMKDHVLISAKKAINELRFDKGNIYVDRQVAGVVMFRQ